MPVLIALKLYSICFQLENLEDATGPVEAILKRCNKQQVSTNMTYLERNPFPLSSSFPRYYHIYMTHL